MPKGKKFNAAEKYFEKKRVKIQSEIDEYIIYSTKLRHEKAEFSYSNTLTVPSNSAFS